MNALRLVLLALFVLPPLFAQTKVQEPEEVFLAYVNACRRGHLEEAAGYVWLMPDKTAKEEAPRFAEVEKRIRRDRWVTHVHAKAVDEPFAALVFTTNKEQSNPEPVLLYRENGVWKLHHMNVSGQLSRRLVGPDLDKASGLIEWGNETKYRVREKSQQATPTP